MNKITSLYTVEPEANDSDQPYRDFCLLYRTRDMQLNGVNQLNHLIKDVQRHRGISMGLLAGNRAFEKDFGVLQRHVDRRLATIEAFIQTENMGVSEDERLNIRQSWSTIRTDWQDDKLSDNFELHSYFIEQLLQLNFAIAKNLERPLLNEFNTVPAEKALLSLSGYSRQTQRVELLNFTCSLLPLIVENMAKIRGLASFSAAMGSAQYHHDRKLRFLMQCAREQNEKIRHCAQRLHEILDGKIDAKYVIGELETKFVRLLELVTHDVLSGRPIHSSSSLLFNLATFLIDKYWGIVENGLDLLRSWHREDMECWVAL